ncbi:MAG: cell division protein DivIVA [Bacilli bacterium]|jgi:hypothetical protein|nr:cell division protein DivIVA [Bacilli bacterium]
MSHKYFTLEEANQHLPIVDQELRTIQKIKQQFEEKYLDLRRRKEIQKGTQGSLNGDPFFMIETELEFLQIEANSHIKGFQLKGIELKDMDIGLVDFPAILNGEEVLLCWRQGEERISYYHSRNEGFSGRKPIA